MYMYLPVSSADTKNIVCESFHVLIIIHYLLQVQSLLEQSFPFSWVLGAPYKSQFLQGREADLG